MRRALSITLLVSGCVSDLAVGMSTAPVVGPDSGVQELEAGVPRLDAGDPPVVYFADAARPSDASARDAGRDAGYDAGPSWLLCLEGECATYIVPFEGCGDARVEVCARPGLSGGCQFTCEDAK